MAFSRQRTRSRKFLRQQGGCLHQIHSRVTFGEPSMNLRQNLEPFSSALLANSQAGDAYRGPQLECERALRPSGAEGPFEQRVRPGGLIKVVREEAHSVDSQNLGGTPTRAAILSAADSDLVNCGFVDRNDKITLLRAGRGYDR
jgi:hypothetical protein